MLNIIDIHGDTNLAPTPSWAKVSLSNKVSFSLGAWDLREYSRKYDTTY